MLYHEVAFPTGVERFRASVDHVTDTVLGIVLAPGDPVAVYTPPSRSTCAVIRYIKAPSGRAVHTRHGVYLGTWWGRPA